MKRFAALALCLAFLFSLPALATISVTTARIVYTGSGVTGPFPVPFYFAADAELVVTKIDATTLAPSSVLVLDTDYTVTGAGTTSGNVTLTATLSSSYKLVIQRSTDFLQSTDYVEGEAFTASTHEEALDKHTRELQELKDASDRSVKLLPGTTDTINVNLAKPAASTVIGWDSTGKALTNYTTTTLSVPSIDMLANYADLAAAVAAIGSTPKTLMVTAASAPDENSTIPCTLKLFFVNGGALNPAAGVVVTICSPDNIIAQPDQTIFGGAGSIEFQKPGTVYVDWWGPDKTGATDAYADLNASIESVPATSTVVFGSGEYLLETGLYVHTGVNLKGNCSAKVADGTNGSTLQAGAGATGSLLTYLPASPYAGQTVIECLTLDGNDVGADGLEIKNASPPVLVKDCVAFDFTGRGYWVNGWLDGATYAAVDNVVFERCWSGLNAIGYAVERHGTGYFGTVTFDQSHVYYCDIGAFLQGDNETNGTAPPYYGFGVKWNGGMMEIGDKDMNATATTTCAAFRVKDGVNLFVENAYIENYSTYCDNSLHYWVTNNSRANLQGGNVSLRHGYQLYEDNSTICQHGYSDQAGSSFGSRWYSSTTPFCMGRNYDLAIFGNPAFPTTGGTRYGYPGEEVVDVYGNRWRQVQKTQEAPYNTFAYGKWLYNNSRWAPVGNRIIIPVDNATLEAGNSMLYWNQADLLLKDLYFVVDEAFTCSGGSVAIGNSSRRYFYITTTQAAAANLTAGAVINAHDNDNATGSALGWSFATTSEHEADNHTITSTTAGTHRALFMPGYSTADITGDWEATLLNSYIGVYPTCGSHWTTGKGYVVMIVESLEY